MSKLRSWFNKENLSSFFKREWEYFFASACILAVYAVLLTARNIFPFGSGVNVNSQYDLLAQIAPFYEHYFDVINGKSSFFYSNAVAGGADLFGIFAFFAISPFSFLFLIFGEGNTYAAAAIVTPLKLISIACAGIYAVKTLYKNIPDYVVSSMGVLYAFCGYTFVSNTYINWMDFLIYVPFVVTAFFNFIKTDKILPLVIPSTMMIYTCFSISCFSLFLVYLAMMAYVLIVVEKQQRAHVTFRLCLALVYTVLAAMPLLVPALLAYLRSGRNTGIFDNLFEDLNALHLYRKLTYIVSDTFFLLLTVAYFVRSKLQTRKDICLFTVGLIFTSYVLIDEICILLNFGSYMSYALRFGFLNSAYSFFVAATFLNSLAWKKPSANGEAECVSAAEQKKASIYTAVCGVVIILHFFVFMMVGSGKWEWAKSSFGSFAYSTGGLEIIGIIAGLVAIAFGAGVLFYKKKWLSLDRIASALCYVVAAQMVFYCGALIWGNTFYPTNYEQYTQLANVAKEIEGNDDFRIKDYNNYLTSDVPLTGHINSFSIFSSVTDADNFAVYDLFNYDGNGTNNLKSGGGNILSDCLLGYKYYFYRHKNGDANVAKLNRGYLEEVLIDGETCRTDNFMLYENIYSFPSAFTVSSGELVMESDYHTNMDTLYSFLGGEGRVINEYNLREKDVVYDEETDSYRIRIYVREEGNWGLITDYTEEDGIVICSGTYNENNTEPFATERLIGYGKSINSWFTMSLKATGSTPLSVESIIQNVRTSVLSLSNVAALYDTVTDNACELTVGDNDYTVRATAENDSTYLFLNYVAIDGMRAYVNGEERALLDNSLNFMLVRLDEGENEVVIEYSSPYPVYAAIAAVASATVIAALYFVTSKAPVFVNKLEKPVYYLAIGLGGAIFAFYIVFPSGVFVFKSLKALIGLFL